MRRRVTEMRYGDIKSIEHARIFPWKTPVIGMAVTLLLFAAPSLRVVFSENAIFWLDSRIQQALALIPPGLIPPGNLGVALIISPLILSAVLFVSGIKAGFNLYCPGRSPIRLSGRFKEAVGFIRDFQDNQVSPGPQAAENNH